MYKNSHDLWDGETINKSDDNAEISFGADSSKVKNFVGNNLPYNIQYFGKFLPINLN